ncbi:MAG: hypothetical protein ABW049_14715 [Spongiibacteraceae bacterium]
MSIQQRTLIGAIAACPAAYGAALLGLALPINRIDATLTAGLFGLLVFVAVVCWAAGAHKFLQLLASTLLPASFVATVLIFLPR